MKIFISTVVENKLSNIAEKFNKDLFQKLSPPLMELTVLRFDGCKKDDEVHLEMKLFGPIKNKWISKITANELNQEDFYFIDEGTLIPPPLKKWKHVHRVKRLNDTKCLVIDDIEYSTGNKVLDMIIYPALYAMFAYRKPIYIKELKK